LLQSFLILILEGEIKALLSIAWVEDPLKAPRISFRALFL